MADVSGQQHRRWCEDREAGHPAGSDCRCYGESVAHAFTQTSTAATAALDGPVLIEIAHTGPGRVEVIYLTTSDAAKVGASLVALADRFADGAEPLRAGMFEQRRRT